MNELTALVPSDVNTAMQMSTMLAKSLLVPEHFRDKPSDVFMAIMFGMEVGIAPVTALLNVYVVKGRPALYADMMVALCKHAPVCEYFRLVSMSATEATWETKRQGDPPLRMQVTWEMALKAKWVERNDKYNTEPDVMLSARAKGRLAKTVYPDVLRGIPQAEALADGDDEEMRIIAPPPPTTRDIIDVPAAAEGPDSPRALLEAIGKAKTQDALRALAPRLERAPESAKAELRAFYGKHKERLAKTESKDDAPDSK